MKIENNDYSVAQDSSTQRVDNNATPRQDAVRGQNRDRQTGDSVSISSTSQQIDSFRNAVNAAPDVRSDRVDAVKSAMQNGTYNVKTAQIADKIIAGDQG